MEILLEKLLNFIKGNDVFAIIEIGVHRAGNEKQLFVPGVGVVSHHFGKGVLTEIARVRLVAVDDQNGTADLVGVAQDGHVQKGKGRGHIPASVGVERALGVTPGGLVVIVVVLYKERSILRQRIHYAACPGVIAGLVVLSSLGVEGFFRLVPGVGAVSGVKVALGIYAGHVVHGGGDGGLDPSVHGRGVECHAAEAADAQNADFLRIHKVRVARKSTAAEKSSV